jgi:hypothetical protein
MNRLISRAAFLLATTCILAVTPSLAPAQTPDDAPTIAKDSLNITAFTVNKYQGNFATWSWVPIIQYRVNGPIPSGGQLWQEFKLPTGPWIKFDSKTKELKAHRYLNIETSGRDSSEDKGVTYTGPVDFTIHLRNELAGTDSVLYTGKFTVARAHSNESGPTAVEHFSYFVDQDWNLPIGYAYFTPDSVAGAKLPTLNVSFWARGDATGFKPHIFFQGKEIGKISFENMEIGAASYKADISDEPTHLTDDSLPEKAKWTRIVCTFPNVKEFDKTGNPPHALPNQTGSIHYLKDNPGEYEVKVLWKDKLARSIKFTIRPDGTLDDSLAAANKLNDNHALVPVQILGDQDGTWNHDAWKTDAFYANPLTGFTPAP